MHAQAPAPNTKASSSYSAPRTPWGDPDLQGTYTNSDESGTPMSRPPELAGKRPEDVTPQEMARLAKERAARIEKTAETIGGTEDNNTGAGPSHWYENYNPKNSRPWMVLDAPDYQVPPTTQEAKDRAAALKAARGGGDGYYTGPFRGPEEFTAYVRCITRGVPGSMMPAIYGNSYDITQSPGFVAIRYEMVHETRVIPLDNRPPASNAIKSYIGEARGHFEGDTLVVVTTNYLEAGAYGGASSALKTTERFKPSGPNTDRLVDQVRGSPHLDAAMEFRHAADARPAVAALRVRVPRGQRRHARHAQGRPRAEKKHGSWELDFGSDYDFVPIFMQRPTGAP